MSPVGMEDSRTVMNAKIRFFSGDTLQQALLQAANHFHLDPDVIAYRSIEKKHGFLKARRKVVIEVDPEAPRRNVVAAPPPAPAPPRPAPPAAPAAAVAPPATPPAPSAAGTEESAVARTRAPLPERLERSESAESAERVAPVRRESERRLERPERLARPEPARGAVPPEAGLVTLPERPRSAGERFPIAEGPAAEAARKGIALLLEVAGLDLAPRVLRDEEERLVVELSGKDADRCFEDEGEILQAFEHLLPRIVRTLSGESVHCRVDCENFHEIREEQLRTLAQRVAGEVRLRQRPRTLEPMNPADRRVVHMTLADDPNVMTESDGDGYFKRVTIRPA